MCVGGVSLGHNNFNTVTQEANSGTRGRPVVGRLRSANLNQPKLARTPEPIMVTLTGVGHSVAGPTVTVDNGFVVRVEGGGVMSGRSRVQPGHVEGDHTNTMMPSNTLHPGAAGADPIALGGHPLPDLALSGPTCVTIRASTGHSTSTRRENDPTEVLPAARQPPKHQSPLRRVSNPGHGRARPISADPGMLMVLASSITPSAWDGGSCHDDEHTVIGRGGGADLRDA